MFEKKSNQIFKNFFKIKEILSNPKEKNIFEQTFKICLSNILDKNKINDIFDKIIQINKMNIGIYIPENIYDTIASNVKQPYIKKVIYEQVEQEKIKSDFVYYTLNINNVDTISNFCLNDDYYLLTNNFFYKSEKNILLKYETKLLEIEINNNKKIKNIGSYIFGEKIFSDKILQDDYLADYNFDSLYQHNIEIENNIKINLALYIHFLIQYVEYIDRLKTKQNNIETLEKKLQKTFEDLKSKFDITSPFDTIKLHKIDMLENKYNDFKKIIFENNQFIEIKPVNDKNIFKRIMC